MLVRMLRGQFVTGVRLKAGETYDVADGVANMLIGQNAAICTEPIVNVGKYQALLDQSGTDAPVPTVLGTNEIGEIVWTRSAAGTYVGTKTDAFPDGRVICHAPAVVPDADVSGAIVADLSRLTNSRLLLHVRDAGGNLVDGFSRLLIDVEVTEP
jgi:hypothetical protein